LQGGGLCKGGEGTAIRAMKGNILLTHCDPQEVKGNPWLLR